MTMPRRPLGGGTSLAKAIAEANYRAAAATVAGIEAIKALRGAWQPRHKYHAISTEVDGHKFPSKSEGAYYAHLKLEQASGRLVFFLRQVPIHLPGGTKLVLDFVEFYANGEIHWRDVKGQILSDFRTKRREIQALYPFKIQTVKMLKSGPVYSED